jgi:uncharacterized protein involved in outer membrane biogenesis
VRRLFVVLAAIVVSLGAIAAIAAYWLFSGDGMRRAIEQQASSRLGQPVKIGQVRGRIFPRAAIELADVRVGEPVRLTLGGVRLGTDLRALLRRRVEDATVIVSNSRIELPLPFELPSTGNGEAGTAAAAEGPVRIVSVRAISLDDIVIVSRGREVRVSADSALDGNRLLLRRFSAQSGATTLEAEGEVDLEPALDARVRAKANRLDVDELLALADAFTPPQRSTATRRASGPPAKIAARVSAETATAGGVEVRQFATDLAVNGEQVTLSPLTFQLFGGRYQGSLNAQLGKTISLTLRSRLQDLDVAQLAAFGGSPDTITGTLTGAGTFSGSGADIGSILGTLRGMGTATISNGVIKRLGLVRTVVLFFGRPAPDTAESTDRFERMDASFSVANKLFRADAFSLNSRDMDVVGSGTMNVGTEALDGRLDLSLSEELSKQAGTDFARFTREGGRIILPARLGGTLANPSITIDAAAAAKRGLRNEVERRLKGILEGFGGR